jgi:hypothetical protein
VRVSYDVEAGGLPSQSEILELFHELRSQWAERNAEYQRMRLAYAGDHWQGQGLELPNEHHYALTANYIGPMVDKDVQLLFGQLPAIMVPPPTADAGGRGLAERIEGILYGNWEFNKAHQQLLNAAFHACVLRRGVLYYWWDAACKQVLWKSVIPENFYPVYDGDELYEAVYVSRRLTRALRAQYPEHADEIRSDDGSNAMSQQVYPSPTVDGQLEPLSDAAYSPNARPEGKESYTTVLDYYRRDGWWVRMAGQYLHSQQLDYGVGEVPFIEIQNGVVGDEQEPVGTIDRILELNQYYNILLSQKADIIRKTANPPVLDQGTGQQVAKLQSALAGDGSVIPARVGSDLKYVVWPTGSMPDIEGQLTEVRDIMFDISGKPRSAFGQAVTNQSGVVTNLALTPTLQSNELRETVWGAALERLNRCILALYERFMAKDAIVFRTEKRSIRGAAVQTTPFDVSMAGEEIAGWHKNRMKWPSAIRTDDPVYLDGVLKKLSNPVQAISLYDALEELGYEDVEARIDRIRAEREDPRIHPEILAQTVESLTALGGLQDPAMDGLADVDSPDGEQEVGMSEGQVGNLTAQPPMPVAA